jgi:hypothetical protein
MKPITTAYEYPEDHSSDEDFDYSECVLVRAMEENPEYSSHDFREVASLTWDIRSVPQRKEYFDKLTDSEGDPLEKVPIVEFPSIETGAKRRYRSQVDDPVLGANNDEKLVEVPADTGLIDPYTKLGREDGMDESLFETCLDNITSNLEDMSGITTVDFFETKVKKRARNMRDEPEWQHREDEIFCRVVEEFAEIHNSNQVEQYRHPSERSETPEWRQILQDAREETGDHLSRTEAEKEKELHDSIDFRSDPCETFSTEEITNAQP